MPSFFFHVAIDIHKSLSVHDNPQIQIDKILHTPFQAITKHIRLDTTLRSQPSKNFQNSSTQGSISKERDCQIENGSISTCADPGKGENDPTSMSLRDDWRYGKISVQIIDMASIASANKPDDKREIVAGAINEMNNRAGGLTTKGRHEPLDAEDQDLGWGIVRLYRDSEETPGLYDDVTSGKGTRGNKASQSQRERNEMPFRDEDCTTLCILAVPSYLTPSDFLGFVGEKTRDDVSHFRMIRTERSNRYMVLMKFRSGKKAREWRKEWNGKSFDGMEVTTPFGYSQNPSQS